MARKINKWRFTHMSEKQFMLLLSVPTGFLAGLSAIIIKKLAHYIRDYFYNVATHDDHYGLLFFILPAIGILFTIIFCRFILKRDVGHGIPGILYAMSYVPLENETTEDYREQNSYSRKDEKQ